MGLAACSRLAFTGALLRSLRDCRRVTRNYSGPEVSFREVMGSSGVFDQFWSDHGLVPRQSFVRMKNRATHRPEPQGRRAELLDHNSKGWEFLSRRLNCGASLLANQIRSPVCRSLLLGSSVVAMVRAAQARLRHDCTPIRGPNSARRRFLS